MITEEERQTLQSLGVYILEDLSRMATSGIFYGIFVVLFTLSATKARQRRAKSRTTRVIFGMTAASFVLGTLYWAAYLAYIALYMRRALVDKHNEPLTGDTLDVIFHGIFVTDEITVWARLIFQTFGDIIVMWRAWVLCEGRRWLVISPLLLLLGACGTTFAYLALTVNYWLYSAASTGSTSLTVDLTVSSSSLSCACNAVSTMLIAYRYWIHRKIWHLGIGSRRSYAESILLLVIESGCVYCILQVIQVVLTYWAGDTSDSARDYAHGIFIEGYVQTTAMYPTIVFLLVEAKRSLADTQIYATILCTEEVGKGDAEQVSSP